MLFPGTDPTPTVEALARKFQITESNGRLVNISMGQGQENVALNALNKGAYFRMVSLTMDSQTSSCFYCLGQTGH